MKLRAYQTRAIESLRAQYQAGRRAPCLVSPTGSGKTVIAAAVIQSAVARGRRVLFAVHRSELLDQSVNKLENAGITDLRIIRAAQDSGSRNAPVSVASIPTITRWGDRMPTADLVVIDECHHTPAKTWARIAGRYAHARILGLTATPQRADGRPLNDIFDSLVVSATVRELTDLGHLVPCRVFAPPRVLDTAQIAQSPTAAYQRHASGERAVVFCMTVEHARQVAAEMNAAGIATGVVHGEMRKDDRRKTLADLDAGTLRAVASIGVLTEGWDSPAVAVCILARKPQHAGLYLQMAGRVLRPSPGKQHATLIDLCGSVHDHGTPDMDRTYSLDGSGISKVDRDAIRQCTTCGGVFRAGPQACPLCGVEMPRRTVEMPTVTGTELVSLEDLPKLQPRAVTLSIQAKFAGTCRACAGRVAVGEDVYWIKGEGVRHVDCRRAA